MAQVDHALQQMHTAEQQVHHQRQQLTLFHQMLASQLAQLDGDTSAAAEAQRTNLNVQMANVLVARQTLTTQVPRGGGPGAVLSIVPERVCV